MMIKKRLTNKLILVYFLVVILPICAVYFVFVILLFSRTLQSESEKYQYEIDMAVNDLETELKVTRSPTGKTCGRRICISITLQ